MKILIDIGHPAHVHYFKNLARYFIFNNGSVLFTTRDKDVVIPLLKSYNFEYINFGKNFKSIFGKIFGGFYFTVRFFIISLSFKPTCILNASPYSAFVAFILRIPHFSIEDTFNMEQVKLYLPFTKIVFTADYDHPSLGKKEIQYSGYQELLYLHPNYFKPDPSILAVLRVKKNEKYVIIRFVSWSSSHDIGHKGISYDNKIRAIREFSKYAKIFVSSEKELPGELEKYNIKTPSVRMHDAIAFAALLYGESATMASESAMLGVPSIFLDNTGRYYTRDLEENYGLVFNYSESLEDQEKSIQKGIELLKIPEIKQEWKKKRNRMLKDKIDVTSYIQ
jgi:predicted glycosyltransferase